MCVKGYILATSGHRKFCAHHGSCRDTASSRSPHPAQTPIWKKKTETNRRKGQNYYLHHPFLSSTSLIACAVKYRTTDLSVWARTALKGKCNLFAVFSRSALLAEAVEQMNGRQATDADRRLLCHGSHLILRVAGNYAKKTLKNQGTFKRAHMLPGAAKLLQRLQLQLFSMVLWLQLLIAISCNYFQPSHGALAARTPVLCQNSQQEHLNSVLTEIHGAHNEKSVPCGSNCDVCLPCSEHANGWKVFITRVW